MDKNKIKQMVYDSEINEVIKWINEVEDESSLYVYSGLFNWDDGWEIPLAILRNPNCSLSVALLLFYYSEGISYLATKDKDDYSGEDDEWVNFVSKLYSDIIAGKYKVGKVGFKVPLLKSEIYKLKKYFGISQEEYIFITDIPGENLDNTIL